MIHQHRYDPDAGDTSSIGPDDIVPADPAPDLTLQQIADLFADGAYVCRDCDRVVDPAIESSPGEPTTCPDCYSHALKELGRW